jgi:hypothetical protein
MTRKLVWNVVFVLAAVGAGLFLSIKPWQVYREQRKIADENVAEMRQAEQARAELMRRKTDVESSAGRERLVRDAGFRKPGEIPVDGGP